MKNETSFSKLTGALALLSCPVALTSIVLIFSAFNWDFETAFTPSKAIAFQPDPSALLRWGWILDILGYYLPLAPIAIWLHHRLSAEAPLHSRLFAFCGLSFVSTGALGAAMLAGATVPLYEAFQSGDAAQKAASAQVFINLNNEVLNGVWNIFAMLLAAVWWLGAGWLLRTQRRWLAVFSTALGAACLLDVLGYVFGVEALASLGLNFYLLAAPVWAACMGWFILKNQGGPGIG
ncbi:MAG: DUF4386 family protein [Bacteroidetes bacterium]|nr:DUF4386 family protein [Bacteroidota bacterium]